MKRLLLVRTEFMRCDPGMLFDAAYALRRIRGGRRKGDARPAAGVAGCIPFSPMGRWRLILPPPESSRPDTGFESFFHFI